ncbi:hypothetical protein CR513_13973, partial [Mucuna pruriens]
MVDALATLSSMLQVNKGQEMIIHVRHQSKIAHYQQLDREEPKADDKPWYHDIKKYLEKGAYLEGSADSTLLHYIDDHEAKGIMEEVHEGTFGTHANGHALARKILRVDYYCTKIESNYCQQAHIITNNGTNLNNKMMNKLCEQFKIKHHNSTPYRPKMNGVVEAANKNIKKIVEKMVVTYKDWHDMLPYALHGYRTSIQTSTRATPYSLVYGTEVVLAEVELEDAEWIHSQLDQLNLIEEKWLTTLCHRQLY